MAFVRYLSDNIVKLSSDYETKIAKLERKLKVLELCEGQYILDWLVQTKPLHLTIYDVEKWEIGKKYEMVFFQSYMLNLFDRHRFLSKIYYSPKEMFEYSIKKTITYLGDMKYTDEYSINNSFNLDVSHLNDCYYEWYPLNKDQEIIIQGNPDSPPLIGPWHINTFPKETRVGDDGPVMLWDDIDGLPKLSI